jgi:hypothetical protein
MIEVFNSIYDSRAWGDGSGPGSHADGLGPYKSFLTRIINQHNIKSVVDCGCGHFGPYSDMDWGDVDYTGVDVSAQCYSLNQPFSNPHRRFFQGDFLDMLFLKADLVLCKDVLQHWSEQHILEGLFKFREFPLALITNSVINGPEPVNGQIETGGYRPLNLFQKPFGLVPVEWDCYKVSTNEQDIKIMMLVRN